MGSIPGDLSRKKFIQLAGLSCLAGSLPQRFIRLEAAPTWPVMQLGQLPQQMQAVLRLVPKLVVNQQGFLTLVDQRNSPPTRLPLAPTQWNLEHSRRWDRLEKGTEWGIVLHWYGDEPGFDRSVEGYLRGFNSLRQVADYTTRTSAHALVGSTDPGEKPGSTGEVAILQTQAPDTDGNPYVASHLQALDYQLHAEKRQYFVRALYELSTRETTVHSILQDWYDGPVVDVNMRTLAVEVTGCHFEVASHAPAIQQVANVVGVIWALMRRYQVKASSLLGHHEIQVDKPDPGKAFMAWLRCLLAARALTENDPVMNELIFGQHLDAGHLPIEAAGIYLSWVRDYFRLVSRPSQMYAWEAQSGYWFLDDLLHGVSLPAATAFNLPLLGVDFHSLAGTGRDDGHEGIDLFVADKHLSGDLNASLIGTGRCVFAGDSSGYHPGKQALFLHRQPDGAEMVSIYGNLDGLGDLQVGKVFPPGYPVGKISQRGWESAFLHFAIAYRYTWEKYLSANPDPPYPASLEWIQEHYLDPLEYLNHPMAFSHPAETRKIAIRPE